MGMDFGETLTNNHNKTKNKRKNNKPMNVHSVHVLLPVLALIFGAVGLAKPAWPLACVGVMLLAINALVS